MNAFENLRKKILQKSLEVSLIGFGAAGLFQGIEFCMAGFAVHGIDKSLEKVQMLNSGKSYVSDIPESDLVPLLKSGKLKCSQDYEAINSADVVVISVSTFLDKTSQPVLSDVLSASQEVVKRLKNGHLILVKSTVPVKTTEEKILPILHERGLKVGRDFFLSYSPERFDVGNRKYLSQPIRVIGGVTERCGKISQILYEQMSSEVILTSPAVAEMAKLFENSFRFVNISLVNELMLICDNMNINVWNVLDAAATKLGFVKFSPGPGIGGPYVPINAQYLLWSAKQVGIHPEILSAAIRTNKKMPDKIVEKITKVLGSKGKKLENSRIFVLGVTYKKDSNDFRGSPALSVISTLISRNVDVEYHDPHCPSLLIEDRKLVSRKISDSLIKESDCIVIMTDHTVFRNYYSQIRRFAKNVIDAKNVLSS
jgi:UDP-N-acetyl-D-glucosamine dehydrogenase